MKKILYLDMDNVLVDFNSVIDKITQPTRDEYAGRLDEVPGIFSLMKPLPGAVEAHLELSTLFDTYILSTAPWENPSAWSDKLNWVNLHLGQPAHKRLILSHNKNLNAGDYLVDDRTKNGVAEFNGVHIHFGTQAYPDWAGVLKYLRANS